MSITKEQLRSLIREQMSNVSEVADDDVPMMPPKPVKPKGIAGTDVPVASLSDGFDAAREAVEAMYSPTDRRYISAMMVIDMAEKQDQQKAKDEEPMSAKDRLSYMWDFDKRSHPDPSGVETTNPFKVTKEHLERIIREELMIVLEAGPAAGSARREKRKAKIDVSGYPRKQGRDDGEAGKEKRKSYKNLSPEEKNEYDEGYKEGKEIKADLEKLKREGLEETSINEQ